LLGDPRQQFAVSIASGHPRASRPLQATQMPFADTPAADDEDFVIH
jgi:hypothetical protein